MNRNATKLFAALRDGDRVEFDIVQGPRPTSQQRREAVMGEKELDYNQRN
jgi:cold shock CspA family protein